MCRGWRLNNIVRSIDYRLEHPDIDLSQTKADLSAPQPFYELQDLIVDHLRYIKGPGNISNQSIQVDDVVNRNKIKDLELQNKHLVNKLKETEHERREFEKVNEAQTLIKSLDLESTIEDLNKQIKNLQQNKGNS